MIAGLESIVNPARTALRGRCKVDIICIPEALGRSRTSKNNNGFNVQSVGYVHEEAVGTDVQVGLSQNGSGFPYGEFARKSLDSCKVWFAVVAQLNDIPNFQQERQQSLLIV